MLHLQDVVRKHHLSSWRRVKHENLEDFSMVISPRCLPGADCQQCRTLSQEYLRQGNDVLRYPISWPGHRKYCRCRCTFDYSLLCQQRIAQGLPRMDRGIAGPDLFVRHLCVCCAL